MNKLQELQEVELRMHLENEIAGESLNLYCKSMHCSYVQHRQAFIKYRPDTEQLDASKQFNQCLHVEFLYSSQHGRQTIILRSLCLVFLSMAQMEAIR